MNRAVFLLAGVRILLFVAFTFTAVSLMAQDTGFMGLNIGMSRDAVMEAAERNDLILVPRNRDVDFFPVEEREILTLSIRPEIPFMYLQFFDDTLYALTIIFDERHVDYFTLSRALEEKYGPCDALTPRWRVWSLESVTVKVEKPAVVKYIALEEFLGVTDFSGDVPLYDEERRKTLLDGL